MWTIPTTHILVFGRETTGLPAEVVNARHRDRLVHHAHALAPYSVSLNLANAATAAAYQAIRKQYR